MKTSNIIVLLLLLVVCSCNNVENNNNMPEREIDATAVKTDAEENLAMHEQLLETKPLSDEEIQNWFPKTIQNLSLERSQKGTLKGIEANGANAFYGGSNNQKFTISITDCAGKGAQKVYKKYARYKNLKDNHEDDTSITRHFSKDGRSGKSVFVKPLNQYAINFLYKDRLAITVSAQHLEQENVFEILDAIPFDDLIKQ